jgi:hypothetical protein
VRLRYAEERGVWMGDAISLCIAAIPNKARIASCLASKMSQLLLAGRVLASDSESLRTSCGLFGFSDRLGRLAPRVSTRKECPRRP